MNLNFLSPQTLLMLLFVLLFHCSCSKDTDLLADYVLAETEETLLSSFLVDDSFIISSQSSYVLDVLSNDNIGSQENVEIIETSEPANGTVVVNDDDTITYTPDANLTEEVEDSFTYTVEVANEDATVSTQTGNVSVTVSENSQTNKQFDFNVKDFGAKGDGVTDDRAAIQEALDTAGKNASPNNKLTVYLPSGIYMMLKSGSTRLEMKENVIFRGDGESSIITIAPDGEKNWGNILRFKGVNNWELRDLVIDGNSGPTQFGGANNVAGDESQGVANIYIGNSNNFIVDNVINRNSWYNAIQIAEVSNGTFSNNQTINTDCGIISYGDVSDVNIDDNLFDGHHWSEPIALYFGNFSNINIRRNIIQNKGYSHGIIVGKQNQTSKLHENILIEDNIIEKTNNGIKVKYGENTNITISGNVLFVENEGIDLSNCSYCTLDSNQIDTSWGGVNFVSPGVNGTYKELASNAGQDAIALFNNINLTFKDNTIRSFGYECTDIDNTTFIVNSGNKCP